MLTKLQNFKDEREAGFTLIELLVVIIIIGILSAIAIPAFLNQRKSAVDSSVQSDVSNVAKQVETLAVKDPYALVENQVIASEGVSKLAFVSMANLMLPSDGVSVSDGTTVHVYGTAKPGEYCIIGVNSGGDVAKTEGYSYDNVDGGLNGAGGACADADGDGKADKAPDVIRAAFATSSGPVAIDENKTYASAYSASFWTAANEYSGDMMVNYTFNGDGTVDFKAVTDSSFNGTVNFIAMDGMTMEARSFSFNLSSGKAQADKVSSTPYNQNLVNSGTAVLGGVQYTLQ